MLVAPGLAFVLRPAQSALQSLQEILGWQTHGEKVVAHVLLCGALGRLRGGVDGRRSRDSRGGGRLADATRSGLRKVAGRGEHWIQFSKGNLQFLHHIPPISVPASLDAHHANCSGSPLQPREDIANSSHRGRETVCFSLEFSRKGGFEPFEVFCHP